MTNEEKLMLIVSDKKTDTLERNRDWIKNRELLRESRKVAFMVLERLDELGWSFFDLAEKMGVNLHFVEKFVTGKEIFALETLVKLRKILEIPISISQYEDKLSKLEWTTNIAVQTIVVNQMTNKGNRIITVSLLTKDVVMQPLTTFHTKNKIQYYNEVLP